jgi:carbonic anhydrase
MRKRAIVLAALSLLATAGSSRANEHGGIGPSEALTRLAQGNRRFISASLTHPDQSAVRRVEQAAGQTPFAIVLCCSDSRVPPEVVFDQGLGNLFVVRVAGNVADDIGIASLEYAAEHLGVHLCVVLGHERCGAVTAAVKGDPLPGHLLNLMEMLAPAVAATSGQPGDRVADAVTANVELTVERLRECAPILNKLVDEGELQVVGAEYDLDTGEVVFTQAVSRPVARRAAPPAGAHTASHAEPVTASPAASHAGH